jgi:hypothetical protein
MAACALSWGAVGDNALLPVDFCRLCSYVAALMLRRLLACFALITGLAAAGAPAQAEVVALASQVEASVSEAATAQGQAAPAVSQPLLRRAFAVIEAAPLPGELGRVAPTVRLRSDRARE